MPYAPQLLENADEGILARTQFAVKDIMHVEGYPTSGGNPTWAAHFGQESHITASIVQKVMDAGAECVGKTVADELAFNHIGENAHYGTPINPKAPSRFCGGSSCGSAAAVAGALVDFAFGTDTGCSIRGPASFCGIWGIRPTHARVASDGIMPLAPSYDTVGWFARTAEMMERVGSVLLGADNIALEEKPKIIMPKDILTQMNKRFADQFMHFVKKFEESFSSVEEGNLMGDYDFAADWFDCFRITQAAEAWETHQDWMIEHQPDLGEGVYERFEMASELEEEDILKAQSQRQELAAHMHTLLENGTIILMPSTMTPAFARSMDSETRLKTRLPHVGLMAFAGIAATPQISMPLMEIDGAPFGISLIGPKGCDVALLALGHRISLATGVVRG